MTRAATPRLSAISNAQWQLTKLTPSERREDLRAKLVLPFIEEFEVPLCSPALGLLEPLSQLGRTTRAGRVTRSMALKPVHLVKLAAVGKGLGRLLQSVALDAVVRREVTPVVVNSKVIVLVDRGHERRHTRVQWEGWRCRKQRRSKC